ncbi:MAG: T9SS type A sorting domain-containing protein [Flavobacteriaceae bacterium]
MKKWVYLGMLLILGSTGVLAQASPTTEQVVQEQKVTVFPNPATQVVNLLGLQNSISAHITISDMYGNSVLKRQWQIKNNALNIPIAHLPTGMYSIHVKSREQEIRLKFYKK